MINNKKIINLFSCITIVSLLLFDHAFSHHNKNGKEKEIKVAIVKEKKDIKIEYCAHKIKKKEAITESSDKIDKEKTITESSGPPKEKDPKNLEFTTITWIITNYHEPKPTQIDDVIKIKKEEDKPSTHWGFTEEANLEDILTDLCVHKKSDQIPTKLDREILNKIKDANGLSQKEFLIKITPEIYNNGIKLPPDLVGKLVYHIPDYLITNTEKEKKNDDEVKSIKKATDDESKWVSENKPEILKLAEKKLSTQKEIITKVKSKLAEVNKDITKLQIDYDRIEKSLNKFFEIKEIKNKGNKDLSVKFEKLYDLKVEHFPESQQIKKLKNDIQKISKPIEELESSNEYTHIVNLLNSIQKANTKKKLEEYKENIEFRNIDTISQEETLNKTKREIDEYSKTILNIEELISEIKKLDESLDSEFNFTNLLIFILVFVLIIAVGFYIYFQNRKLSDLRNVTDRAGRKFNELEGQIKSTSEKLQSVAISSRSSNYPNVIQTSPIEQSKTPEEEIRNKFDELILDYKDTIDNFSKVAEFKQKWNGLALSRKERQDDTKTILINSSRVFEKSEIWCVNFGDKFFAFPGLTVKTNMATYMNLDFEKAQRDFKGVFSITSGSNYSTEPSVLRKGGAGFVVERSGKLTFPQ